MKPTMNRTHTSRDALVDAVTLATGEIMYVPRANLAAAKALYAAQRRALRQMEMMHAFMNEQVTGELAELAG